jgi:peptidoglycan/LPS O-acetylase OafA/YrhL
LMLILASLVSSRLKLEAAFFSWDVWIGLSSAVAVYAGLSARASKSLERITLPLQQTSNVSYSIYLFHTPILVFIASFFFTANSSRWQPDAAHLSLGLFIALVVTLCCLLGWFLTERRTKDFRAWLYAQFSF